MFIKKHKLENGEFVIENTDLLEPCTLRNYAEGVGFSGLCDEAPAIETVEASVKMARELNKQVRITSMGHVEKFFAAGTVQHNSHLAAHAWLAVNGSDVTAE